MGTVVRNFTGTEEEKAAGGCNRLLWTKFDGDSCTAFPVLYEQGAWWIAYMSAGIIVPVLLSVMCKKLKGKQEKRYSVVK